jgi:sugar lactone lactonase YvrE
VAVAGGAVYIADSRNNAIRTLRGGQVSTLAGGSKEPGYADGPKSTARFSGPAGIAVGPDGELLISDTGNHRIRRMRADGTVSTYAGAATPKDDLGRETGGKRDGPAAQAEFRYPVGMAVDGSGAVYVADAGNHAVRRISPSGEVTTVAVEGELKSPTTICFAPDGRMWVSDTGGRSVWEGPAGGPLRKWEPKGGAGDRFMPAGLALAGDGAGSDQKNLYLADSGDHCLFRIEGTRLVLVAGTGDGTAGSTDGGGDVARFLCPAGLAGGGSGDLYLAEFGSNRIRRVSVAMSAKEER